MHQIASHRIFKANWLDWIPARTKVAASPIREKSFEIFEEVTFTLWLQGARYGNSWMPIYLSPRNQLFIRDALGAVPDVSIDSGLTTRTLDFVRSRCGRLLPVMNCFSVLSVTVFSSMAAQPTTRNPAAMKSIVFFMSFSE